MLVFIVIIIIAASIGATTYYLLPSSFGDSISGKDTSKLDKGEAVRHDIRKTEMMARINETRKDINGPSQGNW